MRTGIATVSTSGNLSEKLEAIAAAITLTQRPLRLYWRRLVN